VQFSLRNFDQIVTVFSKLDAFFEQDFPLAERVSGILEIEVLHIFTLVGGIEIVVLEIKHPRWHTLVGFAMPIFEKLGGPSSYFCIVKVNVLSFWLLNPKFVKIT
jgi:hypothetical protein